MTFTFLLRLCLLSAFYMLLEPLKTCLTWHILSRRHFELHNQLICFSCSLKYLFVKKRASETRAIHIHYNELLRGNNFRLATSSTSAAQHPQCTSIVMSCLCCYVTVNITWVIHKTSLHDELRWSLDQLDFLVPLRGGLVANPSTNEMAQFCLLPMFFWFINFRVGQVF